MDEGQDQAESQSRSGKPWRPDLKLEKSVELEALGVTTKITSKKDPETIAVMFLDQTIGGELARRLQQVEDRLAGVSRVRMTETSGSQLCRILPNTNPWEGDCMRKDCTTCSQGGDKNEPCKRRNILYESICNVCMLMLKKVTR